MKKKNDGHPYTKTKWNWKPLACTCIWKDIWFIQSKCCIWKEKWSWYINVDWYALEEAQELN
jgi:hypothetical protein